MQVLLQHGGGKQQRLTADYESIFLLFYTFCSKAGESSINS